MSTATKNSTSFPPRGGEAHWKWATNVPQPLHDSYALVGLRRTGKTAVLHKLFNRLFYYNRKVLPVYISFADYLYRAEPINIYEFAEEFFVGYMRSYLAWSHRKPEFIKWQFDLPDLSDFAHEIQDEFAISSCARYERSVARSTPYGLTRWLISFPMGAARILNMPTTVFIDEFQVLTNVYNPKDDRCIVLTDRFQKAAETRWAPLLVSGSAISLLVEEALGGMLSGRFKIHFLKPLSRSHTHDFVFRLAAKYGITVNEEFAEAVWLLTEGYPYSIRSLMSSESGRTVNYPDLSALAELCVFELTDQRGQLLRHYSREFGKYSHELNSGLTTRRVMLWATKYPGERIDAQRIADELQIKVSEVRASLDKLRWADVVRKIGLISYQGPNDPMMRRYIEYQHLVEIDNLTAEAALLRQTEFKSLGGEVNRQKGAMAEVHIGAVMGRFDGRQVNGKLYFGQAPPLISPNSGRGDASREVTALTPSPSPNSGRGDASREVTLPVFSSIQNRAGIVQEGIVIEIDLIGLWSFTTPLPEEACREVEIEEDSETGEVIIPEPKENPPQSGAWLVQVRYTQKPQGSPAIRKFLKQVEAMVGEKKYDFVQSWYVCKGGFTKPARKLLEEAGVLYSDRESFNKLANLFGFFGLPA